MLEACGYATWETPDPSGRYVFFQVSPDNTLIAKIELAQQKVVETGNYVNGFVVGFSPDDVLVYTQDQQVLNPSTYSIYVFDPATGCIRSWPSQSRSGSKSHLTLNLTTGYSPASG